VLAARNERALRRAVTAIARDGGRATHVVADVSDLDDVERVAQAAVAAFGGFDTWINNAGVGLYARTTEASIDDHRRLFEINYWGVVHGCRAAVPRLRARGGAIVNVGSVTSDRVIPLLGLYSASKHAVKAYTDALRMDLEEEGAPISVSLVKPGSIDTPFYDNARNYLEHEPRPIQPVYAPEVAARTILACATEPIRDIFVGGGGKFMSASDHWAPDVTDALMERTLYEAQQSDRPTRDGRGNLFEPLDGEERGKFDGHVAESSAYTSATLHPAITALAAVGAGLALFAGYRALRADRAPATTAPARSAGRAYEPPADSSGISDTAEAALYAP
jgi:NAD(P)-dependent dehydrogenase (short-subunit alcohol dehydrogenase family)